MNKADREQLARLARKRAQLAKSRVAERQRALLAETEDLLAATYDPDEQAWADVMKAAEAAIREVNERIRQEATALGIPPEFAPAAHVSWYDRGKTQAAERRAELRRVAEKRLDALAASARAAIDERLLDIETELIRDGLSSAEALAFLDRMPDAEALMPALSLDDLGGWSPPAGAAAALLTPNTAADRKRAMIRRAIAQNPGASDRQVAAIAGCSHTTVAACRRSGQSTTTAGQSTTDSPPNSPPG